MTNTVTNIESLAPQLIERYLREHELKFLINQDGQFLVHFCGDDVPDYRVGIGIEGSDAQILTVLVSTETPFSETMRAPAEAFAAGWNRTKRWPKAYLDDDPHGRGLWIVGENCFTLGSGVHRALLDELLDTSMLTGRQLVSDSAQALDGVEDFDTWLRHAG